MSQENKAYIVQLVKQIVHPYFAGEIADILIAHGMTFKTEQQTNADRIRAMTDEELNELFNEIYNAGVDDAVSYDLGQRTNSFEWTMEWLQQPAE